MPGVYRTGGAAGSTLPERVMGLSGLRPTGTAAAAGWTPARLLRPGDRVRGDAGELQVLANGEEAHPQGVTVYNLEVEADHTYFILAEHAQGDADAAWVHNAKFERYVSALEKSRFEAAGNQFTSLTPGNPVRVAPRGSIDPKKLSSSAAKAKIAYKYKIEFDLSDDAMKNMRAAGIGEALGHPGSFSVPAQDLHLLNAGVSNVNIKLANGKKV